MMFGSPSYPSPLDRIRTGKRDRAKQLGLTPHLDISFDANQSYPKACRPHLKNDCSPDVKTRKSLFIGNNLNDVSFSAGHSKGSFSNSPDHAGNTSLGESWSFFNYVGGGQSGVSFPTALRNPNKALCTIDAHTSQILMANDMACELFGYDEAELIGLKLDSLIQLKHKDQRTLKETHLEPSGEVVEISGKVVDVMDSSGLVMPVSLWVKRLDYEGEEPRCLVVMEPVERSVATVEFDTDGTILQCDDQLAYLHGYHHSDDLEGMKINQIIPSFKCPTAGKQITKDVRKQQATGRTRDGATFPLSIYLQLVESGAEGVKGTVKRTPLGDKSLNKTDSEGQKTTAPQKDVYVGVVWVFANIHGMITFLPDGTIHSINENFALMLFGYTQHELIGKHISKLIPDFSDVIEEGDNSVVITPSDEESPQIPTRLNKSESAIDRYSHQSANFDKGVLSGSVQQKILTRTSLFAGPGVTSTPSRSPATTDKRLSDTDMLLEKASEIVRHGTNETTAETKRNPQELHSNLEHVNKSNNSHDSSVSSGASSKTPNTVRENYPGNALLNSLSPIRRPENATGRKKCEFDFTPEHLGVQSSTVKSPQVPPVAQGDAGGNSVKSALLNEENPCLDTLELITARLPSLDLVSSSSDTDSDHAQKVSATKVARSNFAESYSNVSNVKKNGREVDIEISAIGRKGQNQTSELSSGDEKIHSGLSSCANRTDGPLASGTKIIKRQRRSHGGRQQISPSSHANQKSDIAGAEAKGSGHERRSDFSEQGGDGDSGRFSMSMTPLEVTDNSRLAERRSGGLIARGKENRPDNNPVVSRNSPKTKVTSTSFSAFTRPSLSPSSDHHTANVFHLSLDKYDSSERLDTSWQKRLLLRENKILLEKPNKSPIQSSNLSPKNHRQFFPPLQKQESWSSPNYLPDVNTFPEGEFCCQGQHRDGSKLGVTFQVKRVQLEDGNVLYAMWLSRDPREPGEGGRSFANLTLASSLNSTSEAASFSLGEAIVENAQSSSKVYADDPIKVYNENLQQQEGDFSMLAEESVVCLPEGRGLYNQNYHTLRTIGKGAFGFVRLARKKDSLQEVVVKFIRRSKVLAEGWVEDPDLGRVPLEISLLSKLHHDNIVKVIDTYQNEDFYQMVMEKHGSGMDLFEFIDRNPNLDEALASYLFRQIVSAVFYLNSLGIVHRDIKDENVILDEEFQVKLIDFGAAAYLRKGQNFKTFCGTLEYCSPEVLLGKSYRGPELEMWSMGVTLYTLVFRENPFYDVEETIQCILKPPFSVTNTLMLLLACMLRPDPRCRATIEEVNKHNWVNQPVDITQYSWDEVLPNSEFYGNTAADNREDSSAGETDNYNFEFSRDKFLYHGDPRQGRSETGDIDSDSESEGLQTELQRCLNLSDVNTREIYPYGDEEDGDVEYYTGLHNDRRLFGDC